MGLLTNIFKRNLSLTDKKAWDTSYWNLIGAQSSAGVNVTYDKALSYSAVFNAIALLSGTIGGLPLNLYRKKANQGNVVEDRRPLHQLLHFSPNSEMSAMTFRETMTAHVLGWGNCYAEIQRNGMGEVTALWPIPPNRVVIRRIRGELIYEVKVGSETISLPRDRMLHIPGLGFDGIQGYSVISYARETIGLGLAMEEFGARFFGAGTHPGAVAEHPGKLGGEAYDNLKKSLTEQYSGLGKSHKLLILEEGMKINNIGIPPEDAQFLQSRVFSVNEVARWFNVPPHKIKEMSHSTYSNIESQSIEFVTDSIVPWLVRFEQGYDLQLLSPKERNHKFYFKHIVEGLLRGDSESRGKFYSQRFMIGSITPNEIRALEDQNPNPNPLADELWFPMNMVPLSMVLTLPPPPPPIPDVGNEPKPEEGAEEIIKEEERSIPGYRSIRERNSIQKSYHKLFVSTSQRFIEKETKAIKVAANKLLTQRTKAQFSKWLENYYETFGKTIEKDMFPLLMTYAEDIERAANNEIGVKPEMTPELAEFVRQYNETFSLRHTSSSLGQLQAILRDTEPDEMRDAIDTRVGEWQEKSPEKTASNETVRANNAVTKFVFVAGGITRLMWVTQGSKSCPYCQNLNGKIVGVEYPFIGEGLFNPKGADGSMKIRGPHFAPPLHQGCICGISAA